jgi:hypothetical protein
LIFTKGLRDLFNRSSQRQKRNRSAQVNRENLTSSQKGGNETAKKKPRRNFSGGVLGWQAKRKTVKTAPSWKRASAPSVLIGRKTGGSEE